MQNHIFKVSDIRGQIPQDFTIQDSYQIAQAAVTWFAQQSLNLQRIAVAFDGRIHSQETYQQVSQAIVDAGYQVYFLGICPTPVFVYSLHHLSAQAGIMITASGNSVEYHGFKFFLHKNLVQGADITQIYEILQKREFIKLIDQGKVIPCPILEQYVDSLWQEFAHLSQYDFSMMVDCGNGTTGPVMKKLVQRMGWKQVQLLCDQVDGAFPIHTPDPAEQKNMNFLKLQLQQTKKSFGVAFDGDGDRMLAMDNQGNIVFGDRLTALFAQDIFTKYPDKMIIFDTKSEKLSNFMTRTHAKMMTVQHCVKAVYDAMLTHEVIFAGQNHGRFFFKDRHVGCFSDGIYSMLRLLDILVKNRTSFSDIIKKIDEKMNFRSLNFEQSEKIKEL